MTTTIRISVFVSVAVAAVLAAGACGDDDSESGDGAGGSGELATIRLVQPVPGESTFFYPYIVGRELGYYEDEGLKIEYLSASPTLPMPAFVTNGDADVAAESADATLAATAKGGDYRVLYDETIVASDTLSVPVDSDIEDIADLEGKKVGLAGQDDRTILETALGLAGIDLDSVAVVTVGDGGPTVVNALKDGTIDAYGAGLSNVASVRALGVELMDILPDEIANRPGASFIVTPELLAKREEDVVGFMRAWAKATYAGIQNPELVAAVGSKTVPQEYENEQLADEIVDISIEARNPGDEPLGTISRERWVNAMNQLVNTDRLEEGAVDLDKLLDDQYLDAVNDWDRAEVEDDARNWLRQSGGQ